MITSIYDRHFKRLSLVEHLAHDLQFVGDRVKSSYEKSQCNIYINLGIG